MHSLFFPTLFFSIIAEFVRAAQLPQRPIRFFHGLGGSCQAGNPECVETGAGLGSYGSLIEQANDGCRLLTAQIFDESDAVREEFVHGFHLMGFSQGGLIARLVFENCHLVQPLVRSLVTVGSPNLGLDQLPKGPENENDSYFSSIIRYVVQSAENRVKAELKHRDYSFSQMLNPGPTKKALLIDNLIRKSLAPYANLELFLTVYFEKDQVISPLSSQTFGVSFDSAKQQFTPFPESPYFKALGLDQLYLQQKFWFCRSKGDHLSFQQGEREEFNRFSWDNCEYDDQREKLDFEKMYARCVLDDVLQFQFEALECETYGIGGQAKSRVQDLLDELEIEDSDVRAITQPVQVLTMKKGHLI